MITKNKSSFFIVTPNWRLTPVQSLRDKRIRKNSSSSFARGIWKNSSQRVFIFLNPEKPPTRQVAILVAATTPAHVFTYTQRASWHCRQLVPVMHGLELFQDRSPISFHLPRACQSCWIRLWPGFRSHLDVNRLRLRLWNHPAEEERYRIKIDRVQRRRTNPS